MAKITSRFTTLASTTLISKDNHVAQFLQTLDTDANSDLIDVTGIKLTTNIDNVKTRLASVLKTGHIVETGTMNGANLTNLLSPSVLTQIQTTSPKSLVNQAVVTDSAAAKHVAQAVGTQTWQASEVSGKAFVKADDIGNKEIFAFNSDGTVAVYAQDYNDATPNQVLGTWLLNNGQLLVTFMGETTQYTSHKISQDAATLDYWLENTNGTDSVELNEWQATKPFSLTALNGKHLAETIQAGDDCTARTLSFSGSTATIREKCSSKFYETVTLATK